MADSAGPLAVAAPGGPGADLLARVRARLADPLLVRALAVVGLLRAGLGLAGWLAQLADSSVPRGTVLSSLLIPHQGLRFALLGPWQRDDGLWYQLIATRGFSRGGPDDGFLPLYPALVHATGWLVGGDELLAALLVSTAALVVALVLVQRLAGLDLPELGARRTVLYLVLSPTAFFLLAPFTEATFLALSAGCLLAARRGRFGIAAGCAALAAVCRPQGILLVAPLAVELWLAARDRRRQGGPLLDREQLWALLPAGALGAWLAVFAPYSGFRLGPFDANTRYWHLVTVTPWRLLADSLGAVPTHPEEVFNLLGVVLLVAAVPLLWRRLRPSYAVYAALSAVPILLHEASFTPLMSASRYVTVVFPLFMLLALATEDRPRLHRLLVLLLPALMLGRFLDFVHFHVIA